MWLPTGFSANGPCVRCLTCHRQWRVPLGMASLSDNARALLLQHTRACRQQRHIVYLMESAWRRHGKPERKRR